MMTIAIYLKITNITKYKLTVYIDTEEFNF